MEAVLRFLAELGRQVGRISASMTDDRQYYRCRSLESQATCAKPLEKHTLQREFSNFRSRTTIKILKKAGSSHERLAHRFHF